MVHKTGIGALQVDAVIDSQILVLVFTLTAVFEIWRLKGKETITAT